MRAVPAFCRLPDTESAHEAGSYGIVLSREGPHGSVVHDIDARAAALGIRRGSRVVDMRALVPELRVEDADITADQADLDRLTVWSRRWCPWTCTDGTDGLLLDTTGTDHLFGNEVQMLDDMRRAFARLGLTVRLAIAPTIGSAHALARHGPHSSTATPANLADHLRPLDVSALRLNTDTVTLLGRLGLKTIGQLAAVPREALVRRFRRIERIDANPVLRLDQAMGRMAEPLVSPDERESLLVQARLAEPVGTAECLNQILSDLATMLCQRLGQEQLGARHLRFTAYRVDGHAPFVDARTSIASRDPSHLARLFLEKLETIDPGFGIEAASLQAIYADALENMQDALDGEGSETVDIARLVDRLALRLGTGNVLRVHYTGSHLPERGDNATIAEGDTTSASANRVKRTGAMPLRLLMNAEEAKVIHAVPDGSPAQFRWRRRLHVVVKSDGPERIAPEWWRQRGRTRLRDYYRVEDTDGRRFWMYREGLSDDGRGGTPRWFVHGLDA